MLANSLQTRHVVFVYLFGPPRFVTRQEASAVYDAVSEAFKLDDLSFKYGTQDDAATSPKSKGFRFALERKEGRGIFQLAVGNASVNEPIKLLASYAWPPSLEHVHELFDLGATTVLDTLEPSRDGRWELVLAEARIRTTCHVRGDDARSFLKKSVFGGLSDEWLGGLGSTSPTTLSADFEIQESPPTESDLSGPRRELTIQVLREDPKCLFIELMSQWKQFVSPIGAAADGTVEIRNFRGFNDKPSEYIREVTDYLRARLEALGNETETT